MRRIAYLILLMLGGASLFAAPTLDERIARYAGVNAPGLEKLLSTLPADTLADVRFLLENSSDPDLGVLTPGFVMENVRLARQTRSLPYAMCIPDDVFRHFVLPPRIAQEPFEPWRKQFVKELTPFVDHCANIEQAITIINIWCAQQMTFQPTNGRDQGPLLTIRHMHGRCEEMMILFIAAARAVGIPARSAYVPYWNFTDNNHAWTEVWTPQGWKFLGSGEPSNRLSDTWFTQTTGRATIVLSEAFGDFDSPQALRHEGGVTLLNTTGIYNHPKPALIRVHDVSGTPLPGGKVCLYGASYGGEMDMVSLETDDHGLCRIDLGAGAVWVTAVKDSLFAAGMLDTMNDAPSLTLTCTPNHDLDASFVLRFPLPVALPDTLKPQHALDDFDARKELADLRFTKLHANNTKPVEFLPYFDILPRDGETETAFTDRRKAFLDQCAELGQATNDYLSALAAAKGKSDDLNATLRTMIAEWDVKDLAELPDTAAILSTARIYALSRPELPDSLWRKHVLDDTFSRRPAPESGWEPTLYERVKSLKAGSFGATVVNVRDYLDRETVVDDSLRFNYFSGAETPLEYLNQKYLPGGSRNVLAANMLKMLGVPVRWRGFLEYWDGSAFTPVYTPDPAGDKAAAPRSDRSFRVAVYVDGKQVQAEAFANFLVAEFDGEAVSATYFDSEKDSLEQRVSMSVTAGRHYYLEGLVRNGNGDAHCIIRSLGAGDRFEIRLTTPREYADQTALWSESTRKALQKNVRKWGHPDRSKLVIVLHRDKTEPQMRIFDEIWAKRASLNNTDVLIWCDGDLSPILTREQQQAFSVKTGPSWIAPADLPGERNSVGFVQRNYPVIFLLDPAGQIVFSSKGYQMGLGDLLVRKVTK
jgi:hypothetical protein